METSEFVRKKFEAWATEQGHSLVRHPNNDEFYYNRDVSALWVCFSTAYKLGHDEAEENLVNLIYGDKDE